MIYFRMFYTRQGIPRTRPLVAKDAQDAASQASLQMARMRRWCKDVQLERVEDTGICDPRQAELPLAANPG